MAKVVLISCAKKKLHYKSKAQDLYISQLFKKNLQYAKSLKPDKIFILSAKHGLLKLDKEIKPYDVTLNDVPRKIKIKKPQIKVLSKKERKEWANFTLNQLKEMTDIKNDEFIFLAPRRYKEFLLNHIKHHKSPVEDALKQNPKNKRGIGCQLQWLTRKNKNE